MRELKLAEKLLFTSTFSQFHWTVTGINERTSKYLETKSKTLFIPSELLHAGSSHNVSVEVKNGDSVIAKVGAELI